VTFTILIIALLVIIPIAIGIGYIARHASERRRNAPDRVPAKGEAVTLDRSPEMPHRPGATS
jgi:hypothetical protein